MLSLKTAPWSDRLDKFSAFLCAVLLTISGAAAAPEPRPPLEVPDFERFPATHAFDLHQNVSIALLHADDHSKRSDPDACAARIEILLAVYVERWPQFEQWADDPDWRVYWADHFAKTVYRQEIGCHLVDPFEAIINGPSSHYPDAEPADRIPRWCGRWRDGTPAIEQDHAVAALIELAFEDVIPDAISKLYSMSQSHFRSYGYLVAMNPDVTLLLIERSKVRAERLNGIFPLRLSEEERRYAMLHMVSDERRAEIEEAAWNGDWRSILETTGPCRPRDVVMEEAGLPLRRY